MSSLPTILLASQSPRRRQILESLGIPFDAREPLGEEKHPSAQEIEAVTMKNARVKAESLLSTLKQPNGVVIGADTLVVLNDRVMGKPRSKEDVLKMVGELSGQTHLVVTGLALVSPKFGVRESFDRSWITFKTLSPETIENYAATREPYDKAGSYAIQGLGGLFIEKVEGSYTNVMGFPLELFLVELAELTKIPAYQWFLP